MNIKDYKEEFLNGKYIPKKFIPIILAEIKKDLKNQNKDLTF